MGDSLSIHVNSYSRMISTRRENLFSCSAQHFIHAIETNSKGNILCNCDYLRAYCYRNDQKKGFWTTYYYYHLFYFV